jgi:hypothetical protein
MKQIRLIAKHPGSQTPLLVAGVTYSRFVGTIHDAPMEHRYALEANGFAPLYLIGGTVDRPDHRTANEHQPQAGDLFFDSDLAALLVSDGACWRNSVTGAAA